MRITESSMIDHMRGNVQQSQDNYNTTLNQLSTGKKINQVSDDPVAASKSLAVRSMIADMDHYQRNAQAGKLFLQYSDGQLSSVTSLIDQARQVAVAAANGGTLEDSSSATYIGQIDSIIQQVTQLANSDMDGRRIFAGTQTKTEPFTQDDPIHAYHGDDGALTSTVAPGVNIRLNESGQTIFAPIFSALESLKADIRNGDYNSISTNDIGAVDAGLQGVLNARAQIGTKLNQISDTSDRIQSSQVHLQDQLSSLEDTDLATTYTQLQLSQNVYQASLASTAKALQHSLIDYLH
ncbi:MAG: flagellar hook-associated protein FlgL [Capsulimonadaceae bacterium]|nr:flagellar hook-associated protein FlgL [Capsulimonadaceae bacterium]